MLDRDLYAKIAFSDFVAAGGIVFHEHISFNLKSAPVGSLEDFFSNCKNSKTPAKIRLLCWMTSQYSSDSKYIVTVPGFSHFYPIGIKQCMFWADVNT